MLNQMIMMIQDQQLKDALLELRDLYDKLEKKEFFSFDLAMTPSMKYYTGIIIKGCLLYTSQLFLMKRNVLVIKMFNLLMPKMNLKNWFWKSIVPSKEHLVKKIKLCVKLQQG